MVAVAAAVMSRDPLSPEYLGNPLAVPALAGPLFVVGLAALAVVLVSVLVAAGSMVLRFRRARGVERQQLRWLAFAAVLRYRLYDLDRIISRTLAYGLLTVLLGGAYAGAVLGLGQLLGQGRSLVVAGATLAVAAVFQPAHRRVQGTVDRRFNRRRYDATQTIAAFSGRLREQVDLDTLTAELLAVVDQTMQPTRASLTLLSPRPPSV